MSNTAKIQYPTLMTDLTRIFYQQRNRLQAYLNPRHRWISFPNVIQIDTNNLCGPRHCGIFCTYCYPQWMVLRGKRQHVAMPTEWIEWVIKEIAKDGRGLGVLDLFLNGDAMTEPRLPELTRFAKKYIPHIPTQTFTCGTMPESIGNLLTPNLDSVCFTISAHNRELYKIVHRGDKFDDAIKTLTAFLDRRYKHQYCEVHCVLTKDNYKYAQNWWDFFKALVGERALLVLSPLVFTPKNLPTIWAGEGVSQEELEKICVDVAGRHIMWARGHFPDEKPCNLWDNMSIDVEGCILQCCNWYEPTEWNYGTIENAMSEGRRLKDIWAERLANRMRNPICRTCNMKDFDWKEKLARMEVRMG